MFDEPFVRELAYALKACLNEATDKAGGIPAF
jgi:hypothetical protein